jgi:hypothetical protein
MPLTKSRLPRTLAVVGVAIGFGLMATWWYVDKYDPFHLPTWRQSQTMGNISAPASFRFLKGATFILCPGSLLHIFTMDMSDNAIYAAWVLAALLNGPIYYAVGMVIGLIMNRPGAPRE